MKKSKKKSIYIAEDRKKRDSISNLNDENSEKI